MSAVIETPTKTLEQLAQELEDLRTAERELGNALSEKQHELTAALCASGQDEVATPSGLRFVKYTTPSSYKFRASAIEILTDCGLVEKITPKPSITKAKLDELLKAGDLTEMQRATLLDKHCDVTHGTISVKAMSPKKEGAKDA